nr:hypothetical protein [Tanacetum cinerariifolium]GFA46417.1 hypothetical protein [Tanacetum cinerariifolium]
LPFTYLGIPVGFNMLRIKDWNPIIDKFKKRLSKWKAKMISIGGRVRRGVKEKNIEVVKDDVVPSVTVDSENAAKEVTTSASNSLVKFSYANITSKPSGKKVKVRTLFTPEGNGIDVVVSVNSIRAISARFANTAYGFFLGKNVAYLVVANYVRNTWGKYGLVGSMFSSSTGLFSFNLAP